MDKMKQDTIDTCKTMMQELIEQERTQQQEERKLEREELMAEMRRSHQMLMAAFMSTQTNTNTIQEGDKNITTGSVVDNHTMIPLKVRQVSPIVKSENTKKR